MGRLQEVRVPDLGNVGEVAVIGVAVVPGARVAVDDPLVTLESDKAAMDVPASVAGIVREIKVGIGDKVAEGSLILTVESEQAADADPSTQAPAAGALGLAGPALQESVKPPSAPAPLSVPPSTEASPWRPPPVPAYAALSETPSAAAHASPSVRRFARELGVDLTQVHGTGRKGRIQKEDVQGYVKYELARPRATLAGAGGLGLPEMPEVDFAAFGEVETRPLSRIQKISGTRLHRNWVLVPHVTHHGEADITALEQFRKEQGAARPSAAARLTLLPFLVRALVAALKAFPVFNSSLAADGENLVLKRYFHIGVAVDTPEGLLVPVLRDADRKGVLALSEELAALSQRARESKLAPAEMQGGCFTISNLGGIGGSAFSPIVNAPEVAILGVSRGAQRPVYRDGVLVARLLLPLSLSYDHRVIDGAAAARFLAYLCETLADIRRLLL
jgi:pyruvate dehydrogenase E2 component (dihydrolipoamide acetyltransferase)